MSQSVFKQLQKQYVQNGSIRSTTVRGWDTQRFIFARDNENYRNIIHWRRDKAGQSPLLDHHSHRLVSFKTRDVGEFDYGPCNCSGLPRCETGDPKMYGQTDVLQVNEHGTGELFFSPGLSEKICRADVGSDVSRHLRNKSEYYF